MPTITLTLDIALNPVKRRAWVKYELELRGLNLSDVARREDVRQWAVSQALDRPMARLERALARAVEVPVKELFPERYNDQGRRIVRTRTPKSTTSLKNCHVQNRGVA